MTNIECAIKFSIKVDTDHTYQTFMMMNVIFNTYKLQTQLLQ